MKNYIKTHFHFLASIYWNYKIHKYSKSFEKNYIKNWMNSKNEINNIGYKIILDEHALEKGMTSKKPRYFGKEKTMNIINKLLLYEKNRWKHDFAYNLGLEILNEYVKFYEEHNWLEREEYKIVKNFLKDKPIKNNACGIVMLKKEDFINDAMIDYNKFLSSRHSVRSYMEKELLDDDIDKAVSMTIKTPTACNRQMCKIYNISSIDIKNKVYKYAHGLTNFDRKYIGMFVITYDISSLCNEYEIYQGYFNAGLFSMNFVNSLHSLGIGSCFLEYLNSLKEEKKMKDILNIPNNEQIAIMIAAGYYEDNIVSPMSTRKSIEEIYKKV